MMNMDRWHEVFETLRRNKVRTTLTALGVFWGVFMLVVMLGFGRGLESGVMGNIGKWAQNALAVWPAATVKSFAGHKPGRRVTFTTDDVALIRQRIEGVIAVAPRAHSGWGFTSIVTHKDRSDGFSVSGDVPEYLGLEPMRLTAGRFINPMDIEQMRKVAVIGHNVQKGLYKAGDDPTGTEIRINGSPFTVIGVHKSETPGPRADFMDNRIFTPLSTFTRMNGLGNKISYMSVLLDNDHSSRAVEKQILALLRRRHDIAHDDPGGVDSFNREKEFAKFTTLFDGISLLSWTVGVLTLLAGALGVSNILMISISERTKEIGIRKAIGATPNSILLQIVQEALVLTGLSGGLGLIAGVGALAGAAAIFAKLPQGQGPSFFAAPDLHITKALIATAILTVAGGVAGIAPARSALAIKPVEALAHE